MNAKNAKIDDNARCRQCGWPIVMLLCNDDLASTPPWDSYDWWYYCANPTCRHHVGEGVWQDTPDWVIASPHENN